MGNPVGRRLNTRNDTETRAKIQTSQIINRLTDHMLGKVEMDATQVRSAEILLRKSLPDLSAVELQADVQGITVQILGADSNT